MMSANVPTDMLSASAPESITHANLQNISADALVPRLAEAAYYAVLNRLLPALRHEVAGAMQAPRMLLMVVQKRLQAAEPDQQVLADNVATISTLTQQASVSCMAALAWIAPGENTPVGLRSSVDKAAALLAMELFNNSLTLVNGIEDDAVTAPQTFFRSIFTGALLAFCDQHGEGGSLQVTFKPAAATSNLTGQLHLHLLPGAGGKSPALQHAALKSRLIVWSDVQAMAQAAGVHMEQGDSWLSLELPKP